MGDHQPSRGRRALPDVICLALAGADAPRLARSATRCGSLGALWVSRSTVDDATLHEFLSLSANTDGHVGIWVDGSVSPPSEPIVDRGDVAVFVDHLDCAMWSASFPDSRIVPILRSVGDLDAVLDARAAEIVLVGSEAGGRRAGRRFNLRHAESIRKPPQGFPRRAPTCRLSRRHSAPPRPPDPEPMT